MAKTILHANLGYVSHPDGGFEKMKKPPGAGGWVNSGKSLVYAAIAGRNL